MVNARTMCDILAFHEYYCAHLLSLESDMSG